MTSQKQELHLFSGNTLIPHGSLAQRHHLFSTITHIQGTSPTWLTNHLVENALYDTCLLNEGANRRSSVKSDVVFISFTNDFKHYEAGWKKLGMDLNDVKEFKYVDLFTDLFQRIQPTEPESIVKLFQGEIYPVLASLNTASKKPKVVFIEGLEFLLLSTTISSLQLLSLLSKLTASTSSLFVTLPTDTPLHSITEINVQSSRQHQYHDFLIRVLHRTNLNLALRPLTTGKASDVTGSLTVSRGCVPFGDLEKEVLEREYLYLVKAGDSGVRLFFR